MKTLSFYTTFMETSSYFFFLVIAMTAVFYLPGEFIVQIKRPDTYRTLENSSDLFNFYSIQGALYNKNIYQKDIPRIFTLNLAHDFSNQPSHNRTPLFITLVLTNALKSNEAILHIRKRLLYLQQKKKTGLPISGENKRWLETLARRYSSSTDLQQLLDRVDIIPVSLTIAQAITESGWGSSRFAHSGNALFGQHLAKNSKEKYILSRSGNIKVAAFDSIYTSTQSYMHNLNSSRAYKTLRKIRTDLRRNQQPVDGYSMAAGLLHYSAKGSDYIKMIRFIINHYNLTQLEHVALRRDTPDIMIRFVPPAN